MAAPTGYYAVVSGRKVGIFRSWDECEPHVDDFDGAWFERFDSRAEAETFLRSNSICRQPLADRRIQSGPSYYVVIKGKVPGIYWRWSDASKQIENFNGRPWSKKFTNLDEAKHYFEKHFK